MGRAQSRRRCGEGRADSVPVQMWATCSPLAMARDAVSAIVGADLRPRGRGRAGGRKEEAEGGCVRGY